MLFSIVHDPNVSADDLNHDLNLISNWAYQWKMSFNPEPSKQAVEVLFSHKRTDINHPPIYFNNSVVSTKIAHKHLGLTLDSRLSFSDHINEKINLANKIIGVIKYLSNHLPLKILDQMYKVFIHSHFNYVM